MMSHQVYPGNDLKGWMRPELLQWLYATAGRMDSVVEIGSWYGRSTHALLSGTHGPVFAVDHWQGSRTAAGDLDPACRAVQREDVFARFLKNLNHFPNLQVICKPSLEAAALFQDAAVDMVFIDGGHLYEEVRADILAWRPKARKLIAGHDYRSGWPGVVQAVREIFGTNFHTLGSIWYHQIVHHFDQDLG